MLFLVTGASGSGKTSVTAGLRQKHPNAACHEFDEVVAPLGADSAWRQQATEVWLKRTLGYQREGKDTILTGGAIYGEVLACPSAPEIDGIEVCLLDCFDGVRIDRILGSRWPEWATQDTLSWAAWQRMNRVDPQWRPDVIRARSAPGMRWDRWEQWRRGDPRWDHSWRLDTTDLTVEEVGERLCEWIERLKTGS